MSLLMDALKRAETSKQEAARSLSGQAPVSADGLSLEPLSPPAFRSTTSPLPELAAHLESMDADLAQAATPPSKPAEKRPASEHAPPAAVSPRDTARNAFAAKAPPSPARRSPLWWLIGTLGMAGLAIGGYVAYELTSIGGKTLQPTTASVPAAGAPLPPLLAAPAPPSPPLSPIPSAALPDAPPPASAPPPTSAPLLTAPSRAPRSPAQPAAALDEAPPAPERIRLLRTPPPADNSQQTAYSHLQRNELDLARSHYERALQRDPHNTDSLLALAAIAKRQGRSADSELLYQRAMIANPSDPAVQGAVLNTAAAGADPQTTESRLKSLLSAQPESAALNFALGNLYARQKRWPEAQQAYFNAVAADGDNPDYLFNLAISLDQIRQARLAAQHYRLALEAAERRPAAFDRDTVRRRLAELAQ